MEKNLFLMVMEAGGNIAEPFDAGGGMDMGADMGMDASAGAPPDTSMDGGTPPPLPDDPGAGFNDLGFNTDDGGMGGMDMGGDPSGEGEQQEDGTKNGGEKLSAKANSILNQKLYTQMMNRNQEIEDTIESINRLVPLLPYETIKENDFNMTKLKAALDKGKGYLIENFVDAKYGENLIFFQKLDALYTLLIDQLNDNLKKLKNTNESINQLN
jgi:hypothetical protein